MYEFAATEVYKAKGQEGFDNFVKDVFSRPVHKLSYIAESFIKVAIKHRLSTYAIEG
jgi:hypothetical protein